MSNSEKRVRHGLYLSVELLDQVRVAASRENNSLNRQIEKIIAEWAEQQNNSTGFSRKEILNLPLERRRHYLRMQALDIIDYYRKNSDYSGADTDFFDYGMDPATDE